MENLSKNLYVLPGTSELIWNIINETHTKDYQPQGLTRAGKPKKVIPKVKNLNLMYPKYIYVIHTLARECRKKTSDYHIKGGYGLLTSELKKRICEDGPMVTLILEKLQEYHIIKRVMKYSTYGKGQASKYRLEPEYEQLVWQATRETFTRTEHGKMVERLNEVDEHYHRVNEKVNKDLYGDESPKQQKPIKSITMENQTEQRRTTGTQAMTLHQALKNFNKLRSLKVALDVTQPEAIKEVLVKSLEENTTIPEEVKEQLLKYLPEYISTLPTPTTEEDGYLESLYQRSKDAGSLEAVIMKMHDTAFNDGYVGEESKKMYLKVINYMDARMEGKLPKRFIQTRERLAKEEAMKSMLQLA